MKAVLHRNGTRGSADHGWLRSRHTFSFADYYDPERMGFGALRVLNDDMVAPGHGFDTHSHRDMEIVSIPLSGALRHEDSEGNTRVIQSGEVQIMSAGTGISHSEYNASETEPLNFLQIWVLPRQRGIEPRYHEQVSPVAERRDRLQVVVAPGSEGGAMRINQDAWFSLGCFNAGRRVVYRLNAEGNGVYVFVVEGTTDVAGQSLDRRDGVGITEVAEVQIAATGDCQLLVIEVPL